MRELFRPHQKRFAGRVVPTARLLHKRLAVLQCVDLTPDLVRQRTSHAADGIQVLDLDLHSKLCLRLRPHRNVAVTAELSLLHVGIADCSVDQDLLKRNEKRECFLG